MSLNIRRKCHINKFNLNFAVKWAFMFIEYEYFVDKN